jgi:hypothetical protein
MYTHSYMHTHMSAYTHARIHVYIHIVLHTNIHKHIIHTCNLYHTYRHTYIGTYTCIHIVHIYDISYIHTYLHTYIYTYIHTDTHNYICKCIIHTQQHTIHTGDQVGWSIQASGPVTCSRMAAVEGHYNQGKTLCKSVYGHAGWRMSMHFCVWMFIHILVGMYCLLYTWYAMSSFLIFMPNR